MVDRSPSNSLTSTDRIITYSPAYTIVPTYECFNRCTYCNFRTDPGQSPWLSLAAATEQLQALPADTIEILILSGEVHPQHPQRSAWLQRIYDLCQLALDHGFLPHTNVGPLSRTEMATLATVNVSMGLMLEQITPQWQKTVHRHAPSKSPSLRLQQLQQAGELRIPFTTGLLLGLGETIADCHESLEAIATSHNTYGHIQEVILQPYSPGSRELRAQNAPDSASDSASDFDLNQLPALIHQARQILPTTIAIQIPPNLVFQPDLLRACLTAGATDLGGISPHDEVNPDYPHPTAARLQSQIHPDGWQLTPRLPVYPHYRPWLSPYLQSHIDRHRHCPDSTHRTGQTFDHR
jgi:7,8-didemethyl-8-hydroxy-5-deazariboflavin synthase